MRATTAIFLTLLFTATSVGTASAQESADDLLRQYGVDDIVQQYGSYDDDDYDYVYDGANVGSSDDILRQYGVDDIVRQYGQPQYAQPSYPSQPQYRQPTYAQQPQNRQPTYAQQPQPQNRQPTYAQQPQNRQPTYAQQPQPQNRQPSNAQQPARGYSYETHTTTVTTPNGGTQTTTTYTYTITSDDDFDAVMADVDALLRDDDVVYIQPSQPSQTARPAQTAQPSQTARPAQTAQPSQTARPAQTAPQVATNTTPGNATYYARLSNYDKKLYDPLLKAVQEGRRSVTVSGDLDTDTMSRVITAITDDHPELVWMTESFANAKTYSDDVVISTEIEFRYNELISRPTQAKQEFEAAAEQILRVARTKGSDLEKEKYVHDYLVENVQYVHTGTDQSAYSAIVNRQTVCAGYARAFKYLMDRLGIPAFVVEGKLPDDNGVMGGHSWNIVYINGQYYNVDVTSDSVTIVDGNREYQRVDYRLFNKSDADFRKRGYIRESEFTRATVTLPACPKSL